MIMRGDRRGKAFATRSTAEASFSFLWRSTPVNWLRLNAWIPHVDVTKLGLNISCLLLQLD